MPSAHWLRDLLHCDRLVVLPALGIVAAHLLTAGGYGIFRDELYYLASAEHLDWGYVDHPPLVAVGAWIVSHVFGTSLVALRLWPALVAGALVLIAAAMARQYGGGRFAQILAGVAVALAPQYLGMLSIYSMNALDLLVWSSLLLIVVGLLKSHDSRWWVPFGVVAGIGLQNKASVLFLGAGLAIGMLLAGRWRDAANRHMLIGATLAGLIVAPHLVWQFANDWPTAEFIAQATATKNIAFAPADFLVQQVVIMNPVAFPLWLAGLVALLAARDLRPYRAIGWGYLAVLAILLTQNSKPYYLAPFYPVLFAAGGVAIERLAGRSGWGRVRATTLSAVVLSGLLLAPLAKPVLSEDRYVAYAAALGVAPGTDERHELGRLPQFFADMHGWEALAEAVAGVFHALPADEQARACVFAQNYGQAGAIDFFGPRLGLPKAISGHNSYWMWGPRDCTGDVVIVIGGLRDSHLDAFVDVVAQARFDCTDCMPYEDDQTLWVARSLRAPMGAAWLGAKHFD